MEKSVLETEYTPPDRPLSERELQDMRKRMLKKLFIGSVLIDHNCGHFYYAKAGGKKEREYIESKGQHRGNCSVCWKLQRTPKKLRHSAEALVEAYSYNNSGENIGAPLTYSRLDTETCFYTWLYTEFNK